MQTSATRTLRLRNTTSQPALVRLRQDGCLLLKLHIDERGGWTELRVEPAGYEVIVELIQGHRRDRSRAIALGPALARVLAMHRKDDELERLDVQLERAHTGEGFIFENLTAQQVHFHLRHAQQQFAFCLAAPAHQTVTFDPSAPLEVLATVDGIALPPLTLHTLAGRVELAERDHAASVRYTLSHSP